MANYLFYDTLRLNPASGGVLNVAEVLLQSMRAAPHDRVDSVGMRYPRLMRWAMRLRLSRFLAEVLLYNWQLLRAAWRGEQEYALFPNYYLPFALAGGHRDAIVIVHDLQYKRYPEHFSRIKRRWLDWSLRRVAASEAHVVFISQASRLDFERHFGACRRARVIFNPVDAEVAPTHAQTHAQVRSEAQAAPEPARERYLLAAYHFYPHKNFAGLLRLFCRMHAAGLVDTLGITGNGAAAVASLLAQADAQLRARVHHHGLVPRETLAQLYRGATAFVSLSDFEGFNLSAAEAAMLGVPLLLSDIPAHRELFGGYAFFVPNAECDLAPVENYLHTHAATRPAWHHAPRCAPAAVARCYLGLKRAPAPSLQEVLP